MGAFARVLVARLPLLPVEEEGRLQDPALRESFIERIFAYARWKEAVAAGMRRGDLVAFHTAHKLALLAHSPAAYRRLGALVGGMSRGSIAPILEEYGRGFMEALRVPATRGRHVNVLQHMLGYPRDAPARRPQGSLRRSSATTSAASSRSWSRRLSSATTCAARASSTSPARPTSIPIRRSSCSGTASSAWPSRESASAS